MATHSSLPAWKIAWTEELVGLWSYGRKELDMTERLRPSQGLFSLSLSFCVWVCVCVCVCVCVFNKENVTFPFLEAEGGGGGGVK